MATQDSDLSFLATGLVLSEPLPPLTTLVRLGRSGRDLGYVCTDSYVLTHYARLCGLRSNVTVRAGAKVLIGPLRSVGQIVGLRQYSAESLWHLFVAFQDPRYHGAVIPGLPPSKHLVTLVAAAPSSVAVGPSLLLPPVAPPPPLNKPRDFAAAEAGPPSLAVKVGRCELPLYAGELAPEWGVQVGQRVRVPLTTTVLEVAGVTPVSEQQAVLLFALNGTFGRLPLGCELAPACDPAPPPPEEIRCPAMGG